jgi:hypothetical protein
MPRWREILFVTVGTFLGLTPWFAYNLSHDLAGATRILEILGMGSPIDLWFPRGRFEKLVDLFTWDFAAGLMFPASLSTPMWLRKLMITAFAIPFGVGLAFAARRSGGLLLSMRPGADRLAIAPETNCCVRELVFVVYAAIFLSFFFASPFTITPAHEVAAYRLFLPPAVLFLIPVSHTVSHALRHGRVARYSTLGALLLSLTVTGTATVLLAARTAEKAHHISDGTGFVTRGQLLHRKFEPELSHAFAAARRVPNPEQRSQVFVGIGWGIVIRFAKDGNLEFVARQLDSIPVAEKVYVLIGLRFFGPATLQHMKRTLPEGEGTAYYQEMADRFTRFQQLTKDAWDRIPPALRPTPKPKSG